MFFLQALVPRVAYCHIWNSLPTEVHFMFAKNAQWWNRSQLDLFELFADATSCGRQNMRWLGLYVQFHWHGKFVHVLLNTSSWLTHKTPATKIKFGVNNVSGFQSKASDRSSVSFCNHIEAALRNVHMRAPNKLQLLMVDSSRCSWSLRYVHPSIPKFVKRNLIACWY